MATAFNGEGGGTVSDESEGVVLISEGCCDTCKSLLVLLSCCCGKEELQKPRRARIASVGIRVAGRMIGK